MSMKTCPRCEQTLPLSCFFNDKKRKDGKRGRCKACEADILAEWRLKTGKIKSRRVKNDD